MPGPHRKGVYARIANLNGGLKRIAERLSPRKRKRPRVEKNSAPEPSHTHEAPEAIEESLSAPEMPPPTPKKSKAHWGVFPLLSTPKRATDAPKSTEITFSLPPPPSPPKSRRTTVEDAPDDGSVQGFGMNSGRIIELIDDEDNEDSDYDSLFDRDSLFDPDEDSEELDASQACSNMSNDRSRARAIHNHKHMAPTQTDAKAALDDLACMMRGKSRGRSGGYNAPVFDVFVKRRLEGMHALLSLYVCEKSATYNRWGKSAVQAAITLGRPTKFCARTLCRLSRTYIENRTIIPINPYGRWKKSMLMDEDIMSDVKEYLQELGTEITAEKLTTFLSSPEFMEKHGIRRKFTVRTAQRYLNYLGYRFEHQRKGQYIDGHDREDVVSYRDGTFVPEWFALQSRSWAWDVDGQMFEGPYNRGPRVIIWYHDETIFYAHDRRRKTWFHKYAPIKPQPKGEGLSYMIADFISADFGWLRDEGGAARREFEPGKNRDGYFTSKNILEQATAAMDICQRAWPEYEHVFVYDNATTHCKRSDDAPSALKMPKSSKEWLVEVPVYDENGDPKKNPTTGKPLKRRARMADPVFNGRRQSLYWGEGEEGHAGHFKGMAQLLKERGYANAPKLRAQCPKFKCVDPKKGQCCCRRILYNLPDFANQPSLLEKHCQARGFRILFLPKFHCELNPIEQAWGYAKRVYRFYPMSSLQDDLERNAIEALEQVPLQSTRRFFNRTARFMDAYRIGLTGPEAAWASRKYPGHRTLPWNILERLEQTGLRAAEGPETVSAPSARR